MVTSRFTDHSGEKFGRWTVISFAEQRNGMRLWNCQCECGTKRAVAYNNLYGGRSLSCGCWQAEKASQTHFKHGHVGHPIYGTWAGIKNRCYNKKDQDFRHYGGRGIMVCEAWRADFWNFWDDMAPGWRPRLSIERIDVNGNYEPDNCRWATQSEQMRNTRASHFIDTHIGRITISQAAEISGLSVTAIKYRSENNWPIESILDPTRRRRWWRKTD